MDEKRWKKRLKKYADAYAALDQMIETDVRAMSADQLERTRQACDGPTTSNCWWATYSVAQMVRDTVRREQYRRFRKSVLRG